MDFFKSEKQRISFYDASAGFVLLFIIVVMAFEESTSGLPFSEKLQNDILPIIALTLGVIVTILLIKAKNEIYYLQNSLQVLASWHRDPLAHIEEFSPAIYGENRDIARAIVLYAMVKQDEPSDKGNEVQQAKAKQAYNRNITVAKYNIQRTASTALDLHDTWREMYIQMRRLEKKFIELLPCPPGDLSPQPVSHQHASHQPATDQRANEYSSSPETASDTSPSAYSASLSSASPYLSYHLRALFLYLYGLYGKDIFEGDLFEKRETKAYTTSLEDFPSFSKEDEQTIADFYRMLIASGEVGEEKKSPDYDASRLSRILCVST